VQGFGFLGCGFLADFNGNDTYTAKHFAQGASVCGVGVLWDESGFDTYNANAFCQGAGMFGLGMLLDNNGEDIYDCATLGQGGATTLGMGVLSDLDGDDRYYLAIDESKDKLGNLAGYGQGGALFNLEIIHGARNSLHTEVRDCFLMHPAMTATGAKGLV